MHALITLCGFAVPIDFATISLMPNTSHTDRTGPPAIIPVPGSKGATGYGLKRIGKMVEQAVGSDIMG